MKILKNKEYKRLTKYIELLEKQCFSLNTFKDCALNYLRLSPVNPLKLGFHEIYSDDDIFTYRFSNEDIRFLLEPKQNIKLQIFELPRNYYTMRMFESNKDKIIKKLNDQYKGVENGK